MLSRRRRRSRGGLRPPPPASLAGASAEAPTPTASVASTAADVPVALANGVAERAASAGAALSSFRPPPLRTSVRASTPRMARRRDRDPRLANERRDGALARAGGRVRLARRLGRGR